MKMISRESVDQLISKATTSARLRANVNIHDSLDDPVQRFINAMEPGTYVRPHRHLQEGRWELFVLVSGTAVVLFFDSEGRVANRVEMGSMSGAVAVEVPPGTVHAVASLQQGTLLLEVKPGPYIQPTDKDFADWAPAEGHPDCARFERWYREAQVGSVPPR